MSDRGAVTAELAVGMVAVAVVLVAVLATGAATVARLTCLDAARTGARVAALGEPDDVVVAAARRVLGDRGEVRVARDEGWVTVTVSTPFTGWSVLGGARAQGSATSWAEP
ncbi:TadE family type IV pilus minor pilin [Cellulomonas flavigena]|uniref:TadE family type IV pilus minor pilin n=1 Tax=Cellulomonas flavigena TaxID=1711 RepID=UPI0011D27502|nr:TadE family type IV pilus minor pilin [Cellulomonas flavigena]